MRCIYFEMKYETKSPIAHLDVMQHRQVFRTVSGILYLRLHNDLYDIQGAGTIFHNYLKDYFLSRHWIHKYPGIIIATPLYSHLKGTIDANSCSGA